MCGPLLILTGAYRPGFVLTGAVTAASAVVARRTIEHRQSAGP
ncbi:hypothetical protein [Mycolicibacterium palauense]|nr:hypothetical protein [Mycolicibacterium palauense]